MGKWMSYKAEKKEREHAELQENPLKYKVYVFGSIADRHTDKTMYRIDDNI